HQLRQTFPQPVMFFARFCAPSRPCQRPMVFDCNAAIARHTEQFTSCAAAIMYRKFKPTFFLARTVSPPRRVVNPFSVCVRLFSRQNIRTSFGQMKKTKEI